MAAAQDVTALLVEIRDGNADAMDVLFPIVYDHLHRLAHFQRAHGASPTLNTTALVHEVYLNLVGRDGAAWENRKHFFAVAAKAMRHLAINHAKARRRQKRGGGQRPLSLDDVVVLDVERADELVALDEALEELARMSPRQAEVVELRFFVGLTIEETADTLGVSTPTVKRDWTTSRAWLYARVKEILEA